LREPPLPSQPPELVTLRLRLEPRGPQHAARLFSPLRDQELYRFIPQEAPDAVQPLVERYRRVAAGPPSAQERWWNWAALARDDPEQALGTVETTLVDGGSRAVLAYMFARAAWGRGLAYEACQAVCEHLRTVTSVRVIEASIDTRNTRSIALVERLGFACEQRVENADYFKGSPSDEFLFRLSLVKER